MRRRLAVAVAIGGLLLAACSGAGPGASGKTVAFIPNYKAGGGTASATPQGYSSAEQPITVGLGETDATHMFIDLSRAYATARPGLVHRGQLRNRDA